MHFILHVELTRVDDPVVWRTKSVPEGITFHQLHKLLQAAMGWKDCHLYRFSERGMQDMISITSPYDEESGVDARKVLIDKIMMDYLNSDFIREERKRLSYIYDYGDHWEHAIEVTGVKDLFNTGGMLHDGEGACPPEDCGSTHGFQDLKESVRSDRPWMIHGESYTAWLDGNGYKNYDPDKFDVKAAEERVRKVKLGKR